MRTVIYLVLRKPGVGNMHFWASWTCIVLGVAVTILGSIGGCAHPLDHDRLVCELNLVTPPGHSDPGVVALPA